MQDTGYLTSLSIDGEYCLNTSSGAPENLSNVLRVDSNGRVLERGQWPLESILVPRFFDRCVHSSDTDRLVLMSLIGYHANQRGATQSGSWISIREVPF